MDRSLGDSAYVEFNKNLQHVKTVNSMGWATKFFYNNTTATALLDSIVLPVPSTSTAVRRYKFLYNSGLLASIQAPSGSVARTTQLNRTGAVVTSIVDADGFSAMFGYDASNRLTWRRNKLADTTYFDYDNGGALKQSRLSIARTDGAGSDLEESDIIKPRRWENRVGYHRL